MTARSHAELCAKLDSLDVEHAERYRRRDVTGDGISETWCNAYVEDACALLLVPLPTRLRARQQILWLDSVAGQSNGWREVGRLEAGELAQLGALVVATWRNPSPDLARSSHVAMVRGRGAGGELLIAQAGRTNFSCGPLEAGFGVASQHVRFFAHA